MGEITDEMLDKIEELEELYEYFLDEFKNLTTKLDFKMPFSKAILFQYMINNDMFIPNNKYINEEIETHTPFTFKDMWAYQIFTGRNVCRHNSKALDDILTNQKHTSLLLYGTSKIDVSFPKTLDETSKEIAKELRKMYKSGDIEFPEYVGTLNTLEIPYKPKNLTRRNLQNISIFPNHVINLIEENESLYLIDTTLDELYKRVGKHYDFFKSNNYHYFFVDGPNTLFTSIFYSKEECTLFDLLFDTYPLANYKDSLRRKEVLMKLIESYHSTLESFVEDNNNLLTEINNKCLKLSK